MADPTPTTRLEAVNRMLSTIGIARLSNLNSTEREDQDEAEAILDEVTREVQKNGWSWNQDTSYPLEPVNDKFDIPENALQVVFPRSLYPAALSPGPRFTQRDDNGTLRVWDKDNHTFVVTDRDELLVNITWAFEFDELPEAARWYITVRSCRMFANAMMAGDTNIRSFSETDELQALVQLKEAEGETAQRTIYDSYSMALILDRGRRF